MAAMTTLTDAEVQAIAQDVLGREMSDLPFEQVEVRSGEDYDEMPALFLTVRVGAGVPAPLGNGRFGYLRLAVQKVLLARGEERFPYLRLSRSDEESLADEVPTGSS